MNPAYNVHITITLFLTEASALSCSYRQFISYNVLAVGPTCMVRQLNRDGYEGMLQTDAPPVENFWLRHCLYGSAQTR